MGLLCPVVPVSSGIPCQVRAARASPLTQRAAGWSYPAPASICFSRAQGRPLQRRCVMSERESCPAYCFGVKNSCGPVLLWACVSWPNSMSYLYAFLSLDLHEKTQGVDLGAGDGAWGLELGFGAGVHPVRSWMAVETGRPASANKHCPFVSRVYFR